ncbi:MAG: hypothetical protein JWM76_1709 [Pseudonocardiales bacterium]|nr:hypothetical protein [Pseudonocardiales bacterium]
MIGRGMLFVTRYRGIYRAAGVPNGGAAQVWTAVLGSQSVLSHISAAVEWELPVTSDGRIHITRPDRRRFTRAPGLRVHRNQLLPDSVTTRHRLTITTRSETLLDCLGWLPLPAARTLLDRAIQQKWLAAPAMERRLENQPGRWGNRQLKRLHSQLLPGAEAESERRIQRILHRAGITGWISNLTVTFDGSRFRIDIAFPELKIAIEVEGWAFHRTKERRDRDVAKLNALARHGWKLIVFTYEHTEDEAYVVAEVESVLAQRSFYK